MSGKTYLESLREALHDVFAEDERVLLLGEDILDPYGGAFKVSKGLSTLYPDRVLLTPISEGAIVGVSTGLAIRGFLPVAEIMFGDFITLCVDQIINTATKFPLMYKNVQVPIVIRVPMGGGRSYGPTHSQSLEKIFFGTPGLKVVSPSLMHDPGKILKYCILNEKSPVLFVEHKFLYPNLTGLNDKRFRTEIINTGTEGYPVAVSFNYISGNPDLVIYSYGGTAKHVIGAMTELIEEEIRIKAVFPSLINNFDDKILLDLAKDSENIIIAEEGTEGFNWGSELSAKLYETYIKKLKNPIIRISSENNIIPSAKSLEQKMLTNQNKILTTILESLL